MGERLAGHEWHRTGMPLFTVVLVILVIGVLLWLAQTYIPMAQPVRQILTAVVIIFLVVWLFQVAGVLPYLGRVRIR